MFAIVLRPEAFLSPTSSLYTFFAKEHPRRLIMSSLVAVMNISASLIPALIRESLERALPVMSKQSRYWDSFMAVGSGSMSATLLLSWRRAAATPLPTSPAPAIMTLIDPHSIPDGYNHAHGACLINPPIWGFWSIPPLERELLWFCFWKRLCASLTVW